MSELNEKLQEIKRQKDEYIRPENLKKDVTVYGVTGTLESGSGGVKLFDTEEHMQQDTTAQEGDLAVVYRSEIQNIKDGDVITSMTFPKTVVFDTAITTSYSSMLRNSTEPRIYLDIQLSSTDFMIMDMNGTIPEITYTSSDGITYTRTDTNEDTYEIGETTIHDVDEHICKFIQIGGSVFEGLYNCKEVEKINTDLFKGFMANPGETKFTDIYVKNLNVDYSDILNEIGEPYNDYVKHGAGLITEYETLNNIDGRVVIKPKVYYKLWRFQNNIQAPYFFLDNNKYYFASYNGGNFGSSSKSYLVKYDNGTITLTMLDVSDFVRSTINGSYWVYGGVSTEKCILFFDDYYFNNSYDTGIVNNPSDIYLHNPRKENELFKTYNELDYLLAPTQLTASPDYVYGKEFYGKNGVEVGTLGTPDNSFADTNAGVYSKIQKQYENMEPRVLTDDDKTIDKNIYFIPVKSDGTPLLDTSRVTNMMSMFYNCDNLVDIPQLNTDNVTNMFSAFENCNNLKKIAQLNTNKVTNMQYMFRFCVNLVVAPQLNTGNVTDIDFMFGNCTNLVTVPLLDISKVTSIENMFCYCPNLSDESLNNILAMCINATAYISQGTNMRLSYIGLTSEQATKCTTLSNYSAFTSAGWTTGY